MADVTSRKRDPRVPGVITRYKDMGDDTHAEVVTLGEDVTVDGITDPIKTNDDLHTVTLSLDAGNAYADGDVLSIPVEVTSAVRSDGIAVVQSILVVDADGEEAAFDIWFMANNSTIGNANAAENCSDPDQLLGYVGVYAGDYETYNNFSAAQLPPSRLGLELKPDSGTSLWVAAISRGTPTYTAADDLTLKIGFLGS